MKYNLQKYIIKTIWLYFIWSVITVNTYSALCDSGKIPEQGSGICILDTTVLFSNFYLDEYDCELGMRLLQGTVNTCVEGTEVAAPGIFLPNCPIGKRLSQGTNICVDMLMISSTIAQYTPNDTVSISISGQLSGDQDWAGIYRVGDSNDWANVIAWNWVTNGTTDLVNDLKPMPAGEYEVRLFFHNNFDLKASYFFSVKSKDNTTVILGARTVTSTPIEKGKLFASPNGDGDCMSYDNSCDIHTAIYKLSQTNNILFLKGGEYELENRIFINKSGTQEKPLILESIDPHHKAILKANFENNSIIKIYNANYIQIRNIEIKESPKFGIRLRNVNNSIIEGCLVHDNKASGISLWYSNHCTIADNITYNNIDDNIGDADGIQIEQPSGFYVSYDNKILHNTVYDNSDDGIDTFGGIDTIIKYNISYNNLGMDGINGGSGNGIGIKACSKFTKGSKVKYNIAFGNNGNGFECNENDGEGVVFQYNTAYNNGDHGFGINKTYSKAELSKNISLENTKQENDNGIHVDNSWQMDSKIEFISTNHPSQDFLKPVKGSVFEYMGAYANLNEHQNKQVKIFVIGDSTTFAKGEFFDKDTKKFPIMGWSEREAFGNYLLNPENLFPRGRSGASSKSYHTYTNDWKETKKLIKETDISSGAYLFIQFGHNDENAYPEKYETTLDEFYDELAFYVDWSIENNIIPVLITPVERRQKSAGNKNHQTHKEEMYYGNYQQVVKNLATDKGVLLLDLQHKSWTEYNKEIYTDTKSINTVLANKDSGDITHFSPVGAKIVGGWVKELICQSNAQKLCAQFK